MRSYMCQWGVTVTAQVDVRKQPQMLVPPRLPCLGQDLFVVCCVYTRLPVPWASEGPPSCRRRGGATGAAAVESPRVLHTPRQTLYLLSHP